MEWYDMAGKVASQVMEILAVGLGLYAMYFENVAFGDDRMSLTKLICYPPTGANVHHDTGFVTLLGCETSPGLQVDNEAGEWTNATPPAPDTLAVNLGEMLQGMAGLLHSNFASSYCVRGTFFLRLLSWTITPYSA